MNVKATLKPSEGDSATRRQKVERREQAIVAAASELFNSKGYARTTIADIAAQSGVADGTVYLYFKNKDALAHTVIANFYDNLTVTAQAGVDALSTPQERVRFLAVHHLTQIIANWRLLEMVPLLDLSIENYGGSELYQMNKAYTAVFDRVAKNGAAQGLMRGDVLPWVLRDHFYGALEYGSRTILMRGNRKEDVEIFIDDEMKLLFGSSDPKTAPATDTNLLTRLETAAHRIERAAAKFDAGQP